MQTPQNINKIPVDPKPKSPTFFDLMKTLKQMSTYDASSVNHVFIDDPTKPKK